MLWATPTWKFHMVKGMPAMATWTLDHIVKEGYLPLWKYMPLAQRFADKDVRFAMLRCGSLPLDMVGKIYYPIVFTHFKKIHILIV